MESSLEDTQKALRTSNRNRKRPSRLSCSLRSLFFCLRPAPPYRGRVVRLLPIPGIPRSWRHRDTAMTDRLEDIDTTAIEKLVEFKEERDRLKGFREKAEEKKDEVDSAVYERVVSDYDLREAELEKESDPLLAEAAGEYAKLLAIFEELESTADEARSDKEELEFRHEVGELDDDTLAEKLEDPEQTLEECEESLEAAEELKERFLEAVDSEDELQRAIAAGETDSSEVAEDAAGEDAEATAGGEGGAEAGGEDAEEPATLVPEDGGGTPGIEDTFQDFGHRAGDEAESGAGATTVLPTGAAPSDTIVVATADEEAAEEESDPGTMVLPTARLVLTENGESGREYPLGVINNIGRADGNQIQLEEPTVSRKHAVIEATPEGFSLRDLDSDNGTLVNDEPVTECKLHDGDLVQFGAVELVFHSG